MSRRSRRDEEDEPGVKAWLAGEHAQPAGGADQGEYYAADWDNSDSSWHGVGTSGGADSQQWDQGGGPPWEPAAAPWDQGGTEAAQWDQGGTQAAQWDQGGGPPWEGPGDESFGLSSGHPSGPLPPVSGPLPAVDPQGQAEHGWGEPAAGDYPGFGGAGYPGATADPYGGGESYPGGGSGAYSSRHGRDPYQQGESPEQGYQGGGYAGYEGADQTGAGYAQGPYQGGEQYGGEDAYQGQYQGQEGYPGEGDYTGTYQAASGYQAGEEADFTGAGEYPAYGSRHGRSAAAEEGYGDWYTDASDSQSWTRGKYEDDRFVPGMADDTGSGRSRRSSRSTRSGGSGSRGGKGRGRKGRSAAPLILVILLLLLLGIGGGGYFYYYTTYAHPADYSGAGTGTVTVQIKAGDTAAVVGQRLVELGVVASVRAFTNAAKASGNGSGLEPGYYHLHKHMSAALAFKLLMNPKSRVQIKVTIPEGLRLSQIIAKLGKATGNLSGYQQAIKNVSALGLPSFAHNNPEGYLFPATYTIEPGTPPIKVLKEMVTRFGQAAAAVHLPSVAARDHITRGQAIVVASLVQAEGRRLSDYPKIARVIWNRLNANMKLELDSTVLYAANKYGIVATNAELKLKSPYNTYLHYGLPPAPIDCPGEAAMKAAMHAPHANWLYFVTVNPGTGLTKFTDSPTVFARLKAQLEKWLQQHGKG
jgi:peptidoglycan lytic transglycosylase G